MKDGNRIMFSKTKRFVASKEFETERIVIEEVATKKIWLAWDKEIYHDMTEKKIEQQIQEGLALLEEKVKKKDNDPTIPQNLIEDIIKEYNENPNKKTERNVKTILFLLRKMDYTAKRLYKVKDLIEKIEADTGLMLRNGEEYI